MKVQRDDRSFTVEVTADGDGLISRAGTALLAEAADRFGLSAALSQELSPMRERCGRHDPGRVVRDLAISLADGGEALSDLGALREQGALFGPVASDSTAYRVIERIASEPRLLEGLRRARARARARVWKIGLAPGRLTIDLDATLVGAHSEKEGAAGNFKGGFGFHEMLGFFEETSEAAAGLHRPGNAGANTAADQIAVLDEALEQIPGAVVAEIEILMRTDSAGSSHELLRHCREGRIRYSVGLALTEPLRRAVLALPESAWGPALAQDGSPRANGEVCELSGRVDLGSWPEGSRLICRRERPHPGAQLSFTDSGGHRFQAILTDQEGEAAELERRHRARARVEDQIRDAKDTGLSRLPFRSFQMNAVWLELVLVAHDLLAWVKGLALSGELALARPKRLRQRLLHVAGRLAFSGRRARLRLAAGWAWAGELLAAFARLAALPEPAS